MPFLGQINGAGRAATLSCKLCIDGLQDKRMAHLFAVSRCRFAWHPSLAQGAECLSGVQLGGGAAHECSVVGPMSSRRFVEPAGSRQARVSAQLLSIWERGCYRFIPTHQSPRNFNTANGRVFWPKFLTSCRYRFSQKFPEHSFTVVGTLCRDGSERCCNIAFSAYVARTNHEQQ